MNSKFCLIVFLLSTLHTSVRSIAIDDFHCKVPTCRDFHYGLKGYPRHKSYVETCYETVFALQEIPQKYGKCVDEKTGSMNERCIYAVANTIKKCITQLNGVTEKVAQFYCGHTLMKYCAVHVGLERFPFSSDGRK